MRIRSHLLGWAAAALIGVSAIVAADSTLGYEPGDDPFELLSNARTQAADEGKLVLVVAGGDWCIWCHYLNAFLHEQEDIGAALNDTFVVVKAYYGDETDNEEFFSTLPPAPGYPHFWIIAPDGELLKSQGTLELEDGDKSYDRDSFIAFIDGWQAGLR